MLRLFGIIVTIASLAACSSGVSNTGAGGLGSENGKTSLLLFASISPGEGGTFSIDAFPSDTDGDPETDDDVELISTDSATITIEIRDALGEFSRVLQGVTFTRFEITYLAGSGGAPNLGPRTVPGNLTIELSSGTGSGSIQIPLVDLVTKKQFRQQASGSTVFNYTVRVRAIGRDFVTNSRIVVPATVQVEIGEFVGEAG